jgi:hypothetical protein
LVKAAQRTTMITGGWREHCPHKPAARGKSKIDTEFPDGAAIMVGQGA